MCKSPVNTAYSSSLNPSTTINYTLPVNSQVKLVIYNILGKKVYDYALGFQSQGDQSFEFNGQDLSSGHYFYELQTPAGNKVRSMILVK